MTKEEILLEKCKIIISDNLSEFITLNKLINKSNPDLDNIGYITSKSSEILKEFIDNFNIENVLEIMSSDDNFCKDYKVHDIKTYDDIIEVLYDCDKQLPPPVILKNL